MLLVPIYIMVDSKWLWFTSCVLNVVKIQSSSIIGVYTKRATVFEPRAGNHIIDSITCEKCVHCLFRSFAKCVVLSTRLISLHEPLVGVGEYLKSQKTSGSWASLIGNPFYRAFCMLWLSFSLVFFY
jgi:hypothetical protein